MTKTAPKKLISIVIPVYNEEKNIPLIYGEILDMWEKLAEKYDYEIVFVNDGSADKSDLEIEGLASKDKKIKYVELSRNFGKEIAMTAGVRSAKGDAVLTIDSDLQHPVEIIPEFVAKWENGADVVAGIRNGRHGEDLITKFFGYVFYKLMNLISETEIIPNETDFRLIDRVVADSFNKFTERERLTRGLINWLGFKKDYVVFHAKQRKNGKSSFSKLKLLKLALSGFISNSMFPLKFAGYFGLTIVFFDGLLGLFMFADKYLLGDPFGLYFSGPAILTVVNIFLVGLVLTSLGIIALYIGNINKEVTNRPMYVIRRQKT